MTTATALPRHHPVCRAVDNRCERLHLAVGEVVKILFANPKDPFIGTEPKVCLPVFENAIDYVVHKSIFCGVGGKFPILQTIQPATVSADPENAITIFIE